MTRRKMIVAVLALAGCSGGSAQESEPAPKTVVVRAEPVTDTTLARPIVAAGTVAPKDEITLSFKAGGVVARIAVDPGDVVRTGQTLATLELDQADATLAKARSAAEKAQRDLARARRLYADSVVTLVQLQDAETAAELARADLEAAAFDRRHAVIVAPSDGAILRRLAEPGETLSSGAPVLVLGSHARGKVVEVGVTDRDVLSLRRGDPAVARFDALPGEEIHGEVVQIAAAADDATGTYAVEIALRDAGRLTAGLVGQVEIHPGRGTLTTLVPIEAILEADGSAGTVWTLSADGTSAERRRVTLGFVDGDRVAVAHGLDDGARVVTEGAAYLTDDARVRVMP